MAAIVVVLTALFVGTSPAADAWSSLAQRRDAPATVTGTATISGRAYLVENGAPVPVRRARVRLDAIDGGLTETTDTDVNGSFRFERLPAGTFRVTVDKPGFVPRRPPGRAFAPADPFDLAAGLTGTVNVEMTRGSALEGRLLSTNGQPMTDVVVTAMRTGYSHRGAGLVPVRETSADDRGRFRIHSLPAGEYVIQVTPDQRARLSARPDADGRTRGFARVFYPGTSRRSEAQVVSVAAGQDLLNLDFVVTEVLVADVNGTVMTANGAAPAGLGVRMRSVANPSEGVTGFLAPSGSGFMFRNVPPGEYWLVAVAVERADSTPEYAAVRVQVDGRDIPDVPIATAPAPAVHGRLVVDSGEPVPPGVTIVADEALFELPAIGSLPSPTADSSMAPVGTDGTFAFAALFGPRRLRVEDLPAGWALSAIRSGGRNVTDAPFDPVSSASAGPIEVVVTSRSATVSGLVRSAAGDPAPNARVVVFAEDRERWVPGSRFVHSALADADGRFAFSGILPGAYRVAAVPFLDDDAWFDQGVLSLLWTGAELLTLGGGEVRAVDVVIRQR